MWSGRTHPWSHVALVRGSSRIAAICLVVVLTACEFPRKTDSGSPYVRARGVTAERPDDEATVHLLTAMLEDEDPAVRMLAIRRLEQLTGETHGFEYYAPEAERAAAVERWREALRQEDVTNESPQTGASARDGAVG